MFVNLYDDVMLLSLKKQNLSILLSVFQSQTAKATTWAIATARWLSCKQKHLLHFWELSSLITKHTEIKGARVERFFSKHMSSVFVGIEKTVGHLKHLYCYLNWILSLIPRESEVYNFVGNQQWEWNKHGRLNITSLQPGRKAWNMGLFPSPPSDAPLTLHQFSRPTPPLVTRGMDLPLLST